MKKEKEINVEVGFYLIIGVVLVMFAYFLFTNSYNIKKATQELPSNKFVVNNNSLIKSLFVSEKYEQSGLGWCLNKNLTDNNYWVRVNFKNDTDEVNYYFPYTEGNELPKPVMFNRNKNSTCIDISLTVNLNKTKAEILDE